MKETDLFDEFRTSHLVAALVGLVALVVVLAVGSGIYTIRPGEEAAVQMFGAALPNTVTEEGLHWHWPSPIGRTTVVHTQKVRSTEIGFQTLPDEKLDMLSGKNWQRDLDQATMITGDLNIVEVQLVAQYHIADLLSYLFRADDPGVIFDYYAFDENGDVKTYQAHPQGLPDGRTLQDVLEIAMRRAMGQRTIDEALISEREIVEAETLAYAQVLLDEYKTGIQLDSVQMQEVRAPEAVQDAFDDVVRARAERDTRINEAEGFRSRVLPEARGEAEQYLREAEALQATSIAAAQGEADRFLAILQEYKSAPDIISERMYLEMVDAVLPGMYKIFVPEGAQPIILTGQQENGAVPVVVPASGNQAGEE